MDIAAAEKQTNIAMLVEDQSLQDYMAHLLTGANFKVKAYNTQDQTLSGIEEDNPELIICDFKPIRANGADFCKALRKNPKFLHTPVLFILSDTDISNKAKVIYAGGDDYINSYSLEEELLIKVQLCLHRLSRQQDLNPITKLPGQNSLWKELQKRINAKNIFAVYTLDVNKFKEFNLRYGFPKGDEVLRFTASVITNVITNLGSPSDYIAHPQSDNFTFITYIDSIEAIANKIISDFDARISSFYDAEDRKRGYFLLKVRDGNIRKIPFLYISMGITTNENYPLTNPAQIIQLTSELLNYCQKNLEKSMFVKERRKAYP